MEQVTEEMDLAFRTLLVLEVMHTIHLHQRNVLPRDHLFGRSVSSLVVRWMVNLLLPPSKRLHRALEAMSAYAADDEKPDVDGFCDMKTSINRYCPSSKEVCSELSGGIKHKNNSDVGRMGSPASAVQEDATILASAKAIVAREGLEYLSEVPALTTPLGCDDSSAKVSCEEM